MHTITLLSLTVALVFAHYAPSAAAYEEPVYETIAQADGYELRRYSPYLVAQVTVDGDFDRSGGKAFRILAGYIFGKNTLPVTTGRSGDGAESTKMQMTTPVTLHRDETASVERHTYRFVMESQYTLQTLPQPDDSRIVIRELPTQTIAVRRYSGRTTESNFEKNLNALRSALDGTGIKTMAVPRAAVFNGPFTLPFLRRNEVWLVVDPATIQPDDLGLAR